MFMKSVFYSILTSVFLVAISASASLRCEAIFPEPFQPFSMTTESNRVEIKKISTDSDVSRLTVEESAFSADPKVAVIELIRMLVKNSDYKLEDKNVLLKNKFSLGIPLKNGYSLMLNYESKSGQESRFVLQDKINLVTPTGKEIKITDELISPDELKINKSEFLLKDIDESDLDIKLKVPLVVQGELLKNFAELTNYFEYFNKQELRNLFTKTDSLFKIKMQLRLRKAKSVFYNVLIKEPFKFIIGGSLMFAVMNSQLILPSHNSYTHTDQVTPISQIYIEKTISDLQLPLTDKELKQQFNEIQKQVLVEERSNHFSNLKYEDIPLNTQNNFSLKNNLFVFERVDKDTLSKHTYIVFSNDISNQISGANNLGMQYFVMEINAVKYEKLIHFIKNNGSISDLEKTKLQNNKL